MAFNLREIFKALADAEVEYVVVGGFAVIMHGHLRATRDLDLVIGLQPENCAKGMAALSAIGLRPRLPVTLADFADPEKREDWTQNRNMLVFQLWDPANPERSVDIFVREPLDFGTMLSEAVIKPRETAKARSLSAMPNTCGPAGSRVGARWELRDKKLKRGLILTPRAARAVGRTFQQMP